MPLIFIVLLAMLIGTVGFWEAIGAVLGAVAVVVLFWIVLAATIAVGALWLMRRVFSRR